MLLLVQRYLVNSNMCHVHNASHKTEKRWDEKSAMIKDGRCAMQQKLNDFGTLIFWVNY